MKRAAILAVGDELTCGYRLDTNSQAIARRLMTVPLDVVLHLTAGDELKDIQVALRTSLEAAEVVIVSGGLGPTEDDLTRQAVASFFGRPLVEDAEALDRIRERFVRRGRAMPERNRVQAQIPAGSQIIHNQRGTAAGFCLEAAGQHLFVIPGVPYEMEGMLEESVLPRLREMAGTDQFLQQGVTKLFGPSESEVADRIQTMLARDRNPLLGLLPHLGTITVEIVARGASTQEAAALLAADLATLRETFGSAVLCQDERELPQVLGNLLAERRLTLAVAEAAHGTGGLVAARLTEASGDDRWFRRGLVVEAGPSADEIEALAAEMRRAAGADVGLATGPIVCPQDAPPGRPYGVLDIAVDVAGSRSCKRLSHSGERRRIRQFAADAALNLARLRVQDHQG